MIIAIIAEYSLRKFNGKFSKYLSFNDIIHCNGTEESDRFEKWLKVFSKKVFAEFSSAVLGYLLSCSCR